MRLFVTDTMFGSKKLPRRKYSDILFFYFVYSHFVRLSEPECFPYLSLVESDHTKYIRQTAACFVPADVGLQVLECVIIIQYPTYCYTFQEHLSTKRAPELRQI